jgi:hypothetical protein
MALGMEMLVKTLIKALDLDADLVIASAQKLVGDVVGQVKNIDSRVATLEKQNAQLIEQNAVFIAVLSAQGLTKDALEKIAEETPPQLHLTNHQEGNND